MDNEKAESLLSISASPHIRTDEDTRSIMLDVLIALAPALLVSAYMFGIRAILNTLLSVLGCVFFEWGYRKLMKKPGSVGDLSAAVTGVLLSYVLPVSIPWWIILIGDAFAIVLVKQLFGGLGKNFMNPALAARAFLFSWPAAMSKWVKPLSYTGFFRASMADAVTGATPLSSMANGLLPEGTSLMDTFLGNVGGSMGEISAFALLLGGIYLLIRKVLNPRIPLSFLAAVAVLTFLFPLNGQPRFTWMLWQLLSGGVMLGAIFMATDYTTSPVNPTAQIVFGVGCGALTVFIRYFGSYAEGVSYAILIMNATVWLLDKAFPRKRFGVVKEKKEAAK